MIQKYTPFVGTLIFHSILFGLLIMGMRSCTKLPPIEPIQYESLSLAALGDFEPGEGEYVDLGAESAAMSAASGDVNEVIADAQSQVTTQGDDTPSESNNTSNNTNPQPSAQEQQQSAQKSKINNLFDKGKNPSAGDTPGGGGIEGNPDGTLGGKGMFGGSGGEGKWSLKGRGIKSAPSLEKKPDFAGTIYLNITVDSEGKVTSATVDPVQSKVSAEGFKQLSELAIEAAKKARFTTLADSKKQVGSIVITFKLK
jgi:TonB family protein